MGRVLPLMSAAAVVLAAVLAATGSPAFRPYFGALHPAIATTLVVFAGLASLRYLEKAGWFVRQRSGAAGRSLRWSLPVAALLVLPVMAVDFLGGLPGNLNVEAPASLIFYPVMALVAEMVFHATPLAVLLAASTKVIGDGTDRGRVRLVCMGAAALIEPAFQMIFGRAASPPWALAYVGVHVLVINLVALHVFRRYDFVSAFLFRVAYYAFWHIGWGFARLRLPG